MSRPGLGERFRWVNAACDERSFRRRPFGCPGGAVRTRLFQGRSYLANPFTFLLLAVAFGLWVRRMTAPTTRCAPDEGSCRIWEYGGGRANITAEPLIPERRIWQEDPPAPAAAPAATAAAAAAIAAPPG